MRRFSARYQRLQSAIDQTSADIATLPQRDCAWISQARDLTKKARSALEAGAIDGAWTLLNAALRKLIHHRNELSSWQAIARNLEMEISDKDKFPEKHWRSKTIKAQVDEIGGAKAGDIPFILEQALLIRDEQLANTYYRDAVTREQIFRLCLIVIGLTILAICMSVLSVDDVTKLFKPIDGQSVPWFTALFIFFSIAIYGALGATFSALRDFTASKTQNRIPEHVMTTLITSTRPFVGAVSALIVVFAIIGGLLPAFKTEPAQPYFVWALAFVADFFGAIGHTSGIGCSQIKSLDPEFKTCGR
jgi:hypothetical protein